MCKVLRKGLALGCHDDDDDDDDNYYYYYYYKVLRSGPDAGLDFSTPFTLMY